MSILDQVYELAKSVRSRAYAPYSKFKVGAVIKWKGSDEFSVGCNIENSSFGATICAERSAVSSYISKNGVSEIEFVVVIAEMKGLVTPCGICLQTISQFATEQTVIHLADMEGIKKSLPLKHFLPNPFTNW